MSEIVNIDGRAYEYRDGVATPAVDERTCRHCGQALNPGSPAYESRICAAGMRAENPILASFDGPTPRRHPTKLDVIRLIVAVVLLIALTMWFVWLWSRVTL